MTRVRFAPALLLAAGLLTPAARPSPPDRQAPAEASQDAERAEDVEVLRRLLNKAMHAPAAVDVNFSWALGGSRPVVADQLGVTPYRHLTAGQSQLLTAGPPAPAGFDGVYLRGYGAVFTLRLGVVGPDAGVPARADALKETCAKCHDLSKGFKALAPVSDSAARPSEWDQARDEVRGAAPPPAPAAAPGLTTADVCYPGRIVEAVVAALGKYGRNVRHLAAGDHLTVAVTFEGRSGGAAPPPAGYQMQEYSEPVPDPATGGTRYERRSAAVPVGGPPTPADPGAGQGDWKSAVGKATAYADLLVKQGKPREAAEALDRALTGYKGPVLRAPAPPGVTVAEAARAGGEREREVRGVYRTLAQAWLAAGDADKAQAALTLARTFRIEYATEADAGKAARAPAKAVVTVSKRDLDRVTDPAEFRKAVRVEWPGFPAPDAKK